MGAGGAVGGISDGLCIGLPPLVQFGEPWMKAKVVPDVITGKKRICLAISEVVAGSDVANITTVGKKTEVGNVAPP
jgi:alkylation response protein AidB-like acyl-CoA dehydrogenase